MKTTQRKTKHDDSNLEIPELSPKQIKAGTRVGDRYAGLKHSLGSLRRALGLTQVQVAKAAGMTQGDVSMLEGRADLKLSTLRRYAAALGGDVEVALVVNGRRYRLDIGDDGEPSTGRHLPTRASVAKGA